MHATLSTAAYFGYFAGFITGVIFGVWAYKTLNPDLLSQAVELLDKDGNFSGIWMLPRGAKLPAVYCGHVPPRPMPPYGHNFRTDAPRGPPPYTGPQRG